VTIRATIGVIVATLLFATNAAGWTPLKPWPIEDIYTARTVVTGKDERNRPLGFRLCFEDVLVRASGDVTVLDDKRVATLVTQAGRYIVAFSYRDVLEGKPLGDEQGTYDRPHYLTCKFDPVKVDGILKTLGRKPWTGKRPKLVMIVAVHDRKQQGMLTSDGPLDPNMRESLNNAAIRYGMTVRLPTMAALRGEDITLDKAGKASAATLAVVAKASDAELPVVGDLTFSEAATGWIATWTLDVNGQHVRWSVRGVNYDEAFRTGVRGAMRVLSGNGTP
jgi:hypothetical protein